MGLLILSGLAIVLFIVGIAFVVKSIAGGEGRTVSSKGDLSAVAEDLERSQQEQERLRVQLDTLTLELQKAREEYEKTQEQLRSREDQLSTLSAQKEEAAVNEKRYLQQVVRLEKQLRFLSRKADDQARAAVEVIERLCAQKEILSQETQSSASDDLQQDVERLLKEKEEWMEKAREDEARMEELRRSMDEALNELRVENTALVQEAERLADERGQLKTALQALSEGLAKAEALLSARQKTWSEERTVAQKTIQNLQAELDQVRRTQAANEEKLRALFPAEGSEGEPAVINLENLSQRLKALIEENQRLLEREKILHKELLWSRTRAWGLETLFEELKREEAGSAGEGT